MIPLEEIRRARERLGDSVLRTPLVRFDEHVWLKLETLQPIGSFKLRGALSAVRAASPSELAVAQPTAVKVSTIAPIMATRSTTPAA